MKKLEAERRRKLLLHGLALIGLLGAIGCREHSAAAPVPQKPAQPVAQQPAQARDETPEEKSCREFVQRFYDWYTSPVTKDHNHPDGTLNWPDVLKMRNADLSPELSRLLNADLAAKANAPEDGIVGLEDDPFANSQDPSPKFEVKSSSIENGSCRTVVWGMDSGTHRETVEPEAIRRNGKWVFVNFHYAYRAADGKTREYPDDDLIHELKGYRYSPKF